MIRNSFCILDGVGEKLERRIWGEGVLSWDDFIGNDRVSGLSPARKQICNEALTVFTAALADRNAPFFARRVRRREHWRLFDIFRNGAVCLDIETNGYQPDSGGYVTVVGLYDGHEYTSLVRGENLTAESLAGALRPYSYLITFYGAAFDVPFILRSLGDGVSFDMPHFDLCFAAKRLGFKGGLKRLEVELGIEREQAVRGLDGYDAVRLWEQARHGSAEARSLLITYNREDTVNLMEIAATLYDRLRLSTGIEEYLSCGTV